MSDLASPTTAAFHPKESVRAYRIVQSICVAIVALVLALPWLLLR